MAIASSWLRTVFIVVWPPAKLFFWAHPQPLIHLACRAQGFSGLTLNPSVTLTRANGTLHESIQTVNEHIRLWAQP